MTYAVYDSRHEGESAGVRVGTIAFHEAKDDPNTAYIMQKKFELFCQRLGWAEFVGIYDVEEGRAFYFNPSQVYRRGLEELCYKNDEWVKP